MHDLIIGLIILALVPITTAIEWWLPDDGLDG
jgi:hypothetical protein